MVLTVEVDFLASRFGATAFDDRNSAEWPPHPARLFSAMVAAWADATVPAADEEAALRWFESLPPPTIRCAADSEIVWRAIVTHYVPVNDARVSVRDLSGLYQQLRLAQLEVESAQGARDAARASKVLGRTALKARQDSQAVGAVRGDVSPGVLEAGLSVLPELRVRQPRTFPTVRLGQGGSTVQYTWTAAGPDNASRDALDRVLARVARLGHSSTPVSCRVVVPGADSANSAMVTWQAARDGGGARREGAPRVRVPAPGLLDRLVAQFAEDAGARPRVAPARFVYYQPGNAVSRPVPSSLLAGPWRVLAIRRGGRVRLTRTLDLARAVRGALLSGSSDSSPYLLHGHSPGPAGTRTAAGREPHLSIIPLANVGSPFSDGAVHGVALMLPQDATDDDRDVLDKAMHRWRGRAHEGALPLQIQGLLVELEDRGFDFSEPNDNVKTTVLTRRFWSRISRNWASVTPIVLDRFPGRFDEPEWEERAAGTIAEACAHLGLPPPTEVEILWGPPMAGVPAAGPHALRRQPGARFPGYRAGTSGQVRLCVHARVMFAEAIRGPLVIGAGRFAGYGLCVPVATEGAER